MEESANACKRTQGQDEADSTSERTVIASFLCDAISFNMIQKAIPIGRDKVPYDSMSARKGILPFIPSSRASFATRSRFYLPINLFPSEQPGFVNKVTILGVLRALYLRQWCISDRPQSRSTTKCHQERVFCLIPVIASFLCDAISLN